MHVVPHDTSTSNGCAVFAIKATKIICEREAEGGGQIPQNSENYHKNHQARTSPGKQQLILHVNISAMKFK